MSALCSGYVFERYPADAPLTEFALALALADNAHNDGTHIFIGVPAMAVKARQSVRSVKANLQTMLARRWLLIVRGSQGGRGRWVEYRINPDWINGAALAPFPAAPASVDNSPNGATLAPFPGQPEKGETVQPDARNGANGDTAYRTISTVIPPTPQGGEESGKEKPAETQEIAPALQAVIAAWPSRRVELTRTLSAWRRIAPDASQAERIKAAALLKTGTAEWTKDDGQFAPPLHKWLRRRGWLNPDVAQAATPKTASKTGGAQPPSSAPPRLAADLTPEQMAAGKRKAQELLARFRSGSKSSP